LPFNLARAGREKKKEKKKKGVKGKIV